MTGITLGDLRPGDLMFGPIGGIVPGWFPVAVGQFLLADRQARLDWRTWRRIRHVGVVVQAASSIEQKSPWDQHGPKLVQAMPRGAEEIELTAARHWTPDYVYIRPAYEHLGPPRGANWVRDEGTQATAVAAAARGYLGTPYNFLTYGKLAAGKLGWLFGKRLMLKWISTRKDMMCSQLADQALADAGYHVFDDGRLPQDVVPAELYRALLTRPGQWVRPGVFDGPACEWRSTGLF